MSEDADERDPRAARGDDPARADDHTDADGPSDADAVPVRERLQPELPRERLAPVVQALAAALAAVATGYALVGASPAFVVAPVASVVVALTPDVVVRLAITLLGDVGETLALWTAVVATVVLLAAGTYPAVRLAREGVAAGAALAGAVVGTTALLLTGALVPSAATGAAAAVVVAVPHVVPGGHADPAGRRAVLSAVGTALGAGLLGLATAPQSEGTGQVGDGPIAGGADETEQVRGLLATADERSLDVDGLEGLVSEDFYTVDIAQFDPQVPTVDWSLSVTGAVDRERAYRFSEITAREYEHRFETLRCVGERLNGKKCDTALWTGVPIWDLVDSADPQGEYVMLRARDGYFEEFPLEAMRDGMLAVGMNGRALPREHGAPARALVPGHWGEINVKWIDEIEVLDRPAQGYWEKRGWHGTGPVNTVAKLWVVNSLAGGRMEVAGHAYAGTRRVSRVEVSTDDGANWTDATVSDRLPDPRGGTAEDAWRQWVHRYDPPDEAHTVVVRAVDGDGRVQPKERRDAFPSGPTGWVSTTVRP